MAVDIVIKNGQVVLPSGIARCGIAIKDGKIVSIAPEEYLPEATKVIDAKGKHVIPGFVDEHVHLHAQSMVGLDTMEGCFNKESKSAAYGGVTTLAQMSTALAPCDENIRQEIKEWNKGAVVDAVFHHQTTLQEQIDEVDKFPALGIVTIGEIGGYKGPTAKEVAVGYMDDGMMLEIMEKVAKWGPPGRVWFHCENADIITFLKQRVIDEGRTDSGAWTAFRPTWTEVEKIKCYIEIAKGAKCPIGAVHIATGEGPAIIAEAKAEGVDIVGETCPQYLTFTKETFKDWPPFANVNPPLRDKEDNEKLWEGLRKGWLETVGSDHGPWTKEQKGDNIMKARPGIGDVLSTWMPVMLSEGVNKGRITLEKMVEVCCYNPAKYLGILPQKGIISVGSDADITIIDLEKKKIPDAKEMHSSSGYNVYDFLKWELKGWPILTMVRGNVVMEDSKVIGKAGTGQYIKRKLSK